MKITIKFSELKLPFKTIFKQASSTRKIGESIWCEVSRGTTTGWGEGCPRKYVTNETMKGSIQWLSGQVEDISNCIFSLEDLQSWIKENESTIDKHPAAFCALELALLDLFAREKNQSVEEMLGLIAPPQVCSYTGILGNSSEKKFVETLHNYLSLGITDFKIKISGDLNKDLSRVRAIHTAFQQSPKLFSVRLDANNYWKGKPESAIYYLSQFPASLLGIEEPIHPKNFAGLHHISNTLDMPIIIDESACTQKDLKRLDFKNHRFIVNLKVSKMGGILRTLQFIDWLQQQRVPIIIGAHVGETSILTRAGMCAARAVGQNLVGQEGGYGLMLLKKDKVQPSLMFGQEGKIHLDKQCQLVSLNKKIQLPINNWKQGWGLRACS